ncbi:MAG: hypothetical protein ACJ76H_01900 [Bacteriovoracaceae bacterium]
MFPDFFIEKGKEVVSFLHILKAKVLGDDEARKKGVEEALRSMEKEREVYLKEKHEAEMNVDSDVPYRKKNGPDEPGRDISAI